MNDEGRATSGEPDAPSAPPKEAVFLSEVIDPAVEAHIKRFRFTPPTIFVGDCSLAADTLDVFDDGRAEWRANSVISRSGDDAWCSTFEFFDNHGISLWRFGRICSPSLSPPHAVITWVDNNRLFFPSFIFPSIAQVSMRSHC